MLLVVAKRGGMQGASAGRGGRGAPRGGGKLSYLFFSAASIESSSVSRNVDSSPRPLFLECYIARGGRGAPRGGAPRGRGAPRGAPRGRGGFSRGGSSGGRGDFGGRGGFGSRGGF